MKVVNLTQHPASTEQVEAGVIDVSDREELSRLLTFSAEELSFAEDQIALLKSRALAICEIAKKEGAAEVMIGGAPFFMPVLQQALLENGIIVHYALSDRISVEETLSDGTVKKSSVFKHAGFVTFRPVGGEYHCDRCGYSHLDAMGQGGPCPT